mmetsp:Transcript_26678/g.76498  ORF Transcript_26678/g.76498 Transcript_26678/m.76498 type:complete len:83 (+) Transcript_26678:2197-2445(+)
MDGWMSLDEKELRPTTRHERLQIHAAQIVQSICLPVCLSVSLVFPLLCCGQTGQRPTTYLTAHSHGHTDRYDKLTAKGCFSV